MKRAIHNYLYANSAGKLSFKVNFVNVRSEGKRFCGPSGSRLRAVSLLLENPRGRMQDIRSASGKAAAYSIGDCRRTQIRPKIQFKDFKVK